MSQTKISSKYQVVIPKEIRRQAKIKPGEKMVVIFKGGLITLVPERPIAELRGLAKGADAKNLREKKDRF